MGKIKNYLIREDGRLEWICKHGVGHTIGLSYIMMVEIHKKKLDKDSMFVHGCDGCCVKDK